MTFSVGPLFRKAIWTVGSFGVGQALRLLMNIILARLLAPELFGVMSIVNSLRTGLELMSDVGIGQNVICNSEGDNPEFYNTAWTLQFIRGLLLWPIAAALAVPLAHFYNIPQLVYIVPITAFISVLGGDKFNWPSTTTEEVTDRSPQCVWKLSWPLFLLLCIWD